MPNTAPGPQVSAQIWAPASAFGRGMTSRHAVRPEYFGGATCGHNAPLTTLFTPSAPTTRSAASSPPSCTTTARLPSIRTPRTRTPGT
jgi:hypothetical protein